MMEKWRSFVASVGIPRLIIFGFFIVLCIAAVLLDLSLTELLSNILVRIGMNGILVLAMVTGILCGIGLNFGIAVGIIGGLLGALISIEMGLSGWIGFIVAMAIGLALGSVFGYGYGLLLNKVKGSEMTVSTYVGFSIVSLMCIGWLLLPFKNPAIGFAIGQGLRNTITMDDSFGKILTNAFSFTIGGIFVPTGSLVFFALACFLLHLFLRSKVGIAMESAGANPRFATASGINVDKMRILGTTISTALAAGGIIVYAEGFSFLQLYTAPLYMAFAAVAAILIGGASVTNAKITNVIVGVFLYQAIISMGLPVANKIIPEGNLSEVLRLIISNGIILYALSKAKGGAKNE